MHLRSRRLLVPIVLTLAVGVITGCGGGKDDADSSAPSLTPVAVQGKDLAESRCMGCHSTNGSAKSGPTWQHLAGSQVKLSNGASVVADDAYLARAIADPDAETVQGYPKTMAIAIPKGSLADDQVQALVAYIDTLK